MQTNREKLITVTRTTPGYAHVLVEGACGPDVTVEDIKEKFYHEYFGGREAQVSNGRFSAVRHVD